MNVRIKLMLGVMLLTLNAYPQSTGKKMQIREGEIVPDRMLSLMNAPTSAIKLSSYRGKVVVLDFWGTFCTTCIAKFPYLDSLQKSNADKLQILLVNIGDDKNKVSKFLTSFRRRNAGFSLPIVIDDSILSKQFPHLSVPHYVFIDTKGNFLSTSTGKDVTTEAISKIFNGEEIEFHIKNEFVDFDAKKPLFFENNGGDERNVVFKSVIISYLQGIRSEYYSDKKNGMASKLFIRNQPVIRLFLEAYQVFFVNSHIVLEVNNREKFVSDSSEYETVKEETYYSYELITSRQPIQRIYNKFQRDLEDYFGAKGKVEKRKTKCLILSWADSSILKNNKSLDSIKDLRKIVTIEDLAVRLNFRGSIPVINDIKSSVPIRIFYDDESAYTGRAAALHRMLEKNGLKLTEGTREVELFVISDK